MKLGLQPVVDSRSRALVLGSLPSDESIRRQEYYAHPKNQFWPIIFSIFGGKSSIIYEERVDFLLSNGIALWDVLHAADREGSSDTKIRNPVINDISGLLASHPSIEAILLNGRKAEDHFNRRIAASLKSGEVLVNYVPSSSPTPGKHVFSLDEKIDKWREALAHGILRFE